MRAEEFSKVRLLTPKGPLIGPLVMVAFAVDESIKIPSGVKDSKELSAKQREAFYEELIKLPHAIRVVDPSEIDAAVAHNNLNWLEAEHTASLINELQPTRAVVDCPSRNLQAYAEFLRERCPGVEVHVQFKADQEHPVVAAASIIAKVVRDRLVKELHELAGFDFGSGYLTDPKTQDFLNNHFDKDFSGYRKSWKPYKKRVSDSEQNKLF
ncbi:MAG: ribonuclease HII [Candidatus Woesearchaeota archaeon]